MAVFAESRQGTAQQMNRAIALTPYPATPEAWRARYDRLLAFYVGEAYTSGEATAFHLFRALDDNGYEVAQAKRLFGAFRHIIDADVAGFIGGKITLDVADGETEADEEPPLLMAGEAVWKRSRIAEEIERWLTVGATMGAFGIEVLRRADGKAVLMFADPRETQVFYDPETGTTLDTVIIERGYTDAETMNPRDGVVELGTPHVYRRELTRTDVRVFRDGVPMPEEGGPHRLGTVPFVWLPWKPCPDPEHGFSAAHGIEGALMRADSLMEEIGAIANRYGYPWMIAKGFTLADATKAGSFARILSGVPVDGDLVAVVAGADAIAPLLAAIAACVEEIRQAPEFLFTDGGANQSGEAVSYKAAAFEAKITLARSRLLPGLARAVWYGTLMDRNAAVTPEMADRDVFCVEAGPILPRNIAAEVKILALVKGDLLPADYTRELQRLGIVPNDEDPEKYAEAVAAIAADKAAQAADLAAVSATRFFGPGKTPAGG